ncbi:MAG: glycosyltransferase family 9 protein [Bacteroidales bacterium]|nr:glycosyltransferase family 9 protein [Bacteroidales bacterium]
MVKSIIKVLVLRFSSIGDIVLTSPVPRLIKQQLPGAEVHYATKRSFYILLQHNPYIDRFHLLEDSFEDLVKELKEEQFDYIIDLHDNVRSSLIKLKLGVPSFTYDKQRWKRWLLVHCKINRMGRHIVDRYVDTLSKLGIKNDGSGVDYFIVPSEEVSLDSLPESFRSGFIVLVVGTAQFTKQLPLEKQIEICRGIHFPVLLLGGSKEIELGQKIAGAGPHVLNACGQYSLNQCASLIRQSELVISNDTGLMHIAAAFGKPILATYGNSVSAFGFDPYLPHPETRIFEVPLSCRPCTKFGGNSCPKGHFHCMQKINSADIISAAERILGINEKP